MDENRPAVVQAGEGGIQAFNHEFLNTLVESVDLPSVRASVLLGVLPLPADPSLVVVFRSCERAFIVRQTCGTKDDLALRIIPKASKLAVGCGYGFEFLMQRRRSVRI
jgi:hypothetical protein